MRPEIVVAVVLLSAAGSGCASWHGVGREDLSQYLDRERPAKLRISLSDSTLVLKRPVLHRDSLLGIVNGSRPPQYAAIATTDVRKIETRTVVGSPSAKVAAGVLGGLMVAFLVAVMITGTPSQRNP